VSADPADLQSHSMEFVFL